MIRLGARFSAYRHAPALADLVHSFLPRFPELDALDFELDLLPSSSWFLGVTDHDRDPPRIRLRPARPSNPTLTYTIPHELTHLLQIPIGQVPRGERACDLHAIARAGDRFLVPPGYVKVPRTAKEDWSRWSLPAALLARDALHRRGGGLRTYIVWWETAFRALASPITTRRGVSSGTGSPRHSGGSPAGGSTGRT
ncbi:MAG TPA: hypothetical protein VGR51_00565 [Thermoplasmata archaeon]|nr:hypothetical protein [Thermoplasmata archaeon]